MRALFFIAIQNMKKKKGDVIVFFLLIALAALLFYTSISVFSGLNKVLDRAYEKAHTADFFYMSNVERERIGEIITAQEEVAEYETSDCIYLLEAEYRKEGEQENRQGQFCFGKIEDERKIGKLVGFEGTDVAYDSIALPYYMKAAEGISVGDVYYFVIGNREYTFRVAGFVEDPLFATPTNISVYGAYISESRMEHLMKEHSAVEMPEYVQHKVRLKQGEDILAFDAKLLSLLTKEIPEISKTINLGINWETMKGGVGMMSRISMGILFVFSVLLIFVILIIIRFSIRNYIEMNLKNIGILQAAGYTSRQLNITVLMEMGMIAAVAVIAGILLGIGGSSIIGKFEGIMLGLPWQQTFHIGAAGITAVVILGVVMGVAFAGGRIYKKITVLEALRGGIHTHNFKKNYFAFDKYHLPVPLTLAGKNIMNEKAKNVSIFCIVMVLSFSACVGFGLYENFAVRNDTLLKLVGSEAGNLYISGDNLEKCGKELEEWTEIQKVLYYNQCSIQVQSKEEKTTITCDIWEQPELVENEMLVRGRLPKYENEIVLTTNIAELLKIEVGDTIYVTGTGERKDYIVCGIDQKINNMGLKAMMSREGAKRLNGNSKIMFLYVYTTEGITYEEISDKITNRFSDLSITNSEKAIQNIMNGVTMAMTVICLLFLVITIFVVAMVETLLIKTKVIRERRNLGLNKAIGFTTGQLILQIMVMNLPVITVAAIGGACLSNCFMEPLVVACLSFSGIEKCPFTVNFFWMVVTVLMVIVVAGIASFLSSVSIRKIEPVKMLAEE